VPVTFDYSERIPNNVDLASDRRLQRALESWQPKFLTWWSELGPSQFQDRDVFLRTAIGVDRDGWADYDYVRLPEYRWGIFLSEREKDRQIGFGDHKGEAVWQEVPGEYRNMLRRLIVVQGDTEPASVEQQRHLGATAPSLYDLRNLFQVNVEEGRHLWAMVYLLQRYFGRDGRDEADGMLQRHSGDKDNPRILGAFNEPTPDWLSFFCFAFFTDRDGKFQLGALKESAFDPLARTCDFMLKEEAHHLFVGAQGIGRIVERTAELMLAKDTDDVRPHGGIDLGTLQRYLNFHWSVSLDLFGAEVSTNGATSYTSSVKGRFNEDRYDDDHSLHEVDIDVPSFAGGIIGTKTARSVNAVNLQLQEAFRQDCSKGLARWNRTLSDSGIDHQLTLPHIAFNRRVGVFADADVSPDGSVLSAEAWQAAASDWLPNADDRMFVASLMRPCFERGRMASWIGPPSTGISGQPTDYDYVRI
jgi:benzoyl-CoA 2,3-dioxygenase component B